MKRFADSLARQKGIKPPPGYKTSISICRKFLNKHVPTKAEGKTPGKLDPKPPSPAQMLYAKKIAQGKGVVIPEEARANSAAMSAWIDFEPRGEAPQARSQDRLQAGRISCASIDGDDEEVSETQTGCLCHSTGSRAAKFGYRYTATDSLWQQGSRSEAWRPLWLGVDGMPHLELIFLHSESAGGCNAGRVAPRLRRGVAHCRHAPANRLNGFLLAAGPLLSTRRYSGSRKPAERVPTASPTIPSAAAKRCQAARTSYLRSPTRWVKDAACRLRRR